MNLKTIITTVGFALLSLAGAVSAADCTFVRATKVSDNCWAREDSCGNVRYIGICYTSQRKREHGKKAKQRETRAGLAVQKDAVFVPAVPSTCARETA